MTYTSLMLHLELGHLNAGLLRITADLAERFEAGVIGIAACQPMQMLYSEGVVPGVFIEQDRKQIEQEIRQTEVEFRSALQGRVPHLEWRSTVNFTALADDVVREARSADLIISGVSSGPLFDTQRSLNLGDLVMQAGRPVLIVPSAAQSLNLQHAVIGWKDTRESRRAIVDALPLLQKLAHVTVVEIAYAEELAVARTHLDDVVGWLEQHGVSAQNLALPSTGDDQGRLKEIAAEHHADLVVAGAYGHSRWREWVLGGMTRELLQPTERCSLLSH